MRPTSSNSSHEDRDAGQMLLATGVVLLMSLLSMAIFGVKVAGLTMPHDTASDGVLVTSQEVVDAVPELTQARTQLWINGGLEPLQAGELAFQSVHDDILYHGELRGVEIKLIDIQVNETSPTILHFSGELGISDGSAMLTIPIAFDVAHA
ncbi:MAG: hypothetical protein HOL22_03005 [Euryarchaeota archaeon]|nr:hypothetical protein [Euryarchaeota archaeon]MBT5595296.1 hypothetical protein [Euryarchaeota archaeon]